MTFEDHDEAHFPAQPARPQAPPRLPRADSHRRRPQRAARPPRSRPQEVVGLTAAAGLPAPAPEKQPIVVLTRRADFLAANRGLRIARPGFVLLANPNREPEGEGAAAGEGGKGLRFGITVTKRIGNAVVRNRMKRRFRELLRELLPTHGLADTDHVLIGREGGIERDYASLREELIAALARARAGKGDKPRPPRKSR